MSLEVVGRDMVEELAERLDLVLLLGGHGQAGLVEHSLGAHDAGAGAQRQGDRVGRSRTDLGPSVEDELGEEHPVADVDDAHLVELLAGGLQHVPHQVVRQRTRRGDALLREGDGRRLDGADPDGQIALPAASRNSTIGWLEGISTRTPTTSISRMPPPYSVP